MVTTALKGRRRGLVGGWGVYWRVWGVCWGEIGEVIDICDGSFEGIQRVPYPPLVEMAKWRGRGSQGKTAEYRNTVKPSLHLLPSRDNTTYGVQYGTGTGPMQAPTIGRNGKNKKNRDPLFPLWRFLGVIETGIAWTVLGGLDVP